MSDRISIKDLEWLVDSLNEKAQDKRFALDGAYGGWKLVELCENGGTRNVTCSGYTNKRQLWHEINAFLNGYSLAKR